MSNLIPKKAGAAFINFFLFGLFVSGSKGLFVLLSLESMSFANYRLLTFNVYFLMTQMVTLVVVLFYYKMQGSLGYVCVQLKIRGEKSENLSFMAYLIRCIPFYLFALAGTGVQYDIVPQAKEIKGLIYFIIGFSALLFIIVNGISIYFLRGTSFIDKLSRTVVVARYTQVDLEHPRLRG